MSNFYNVRDKRVVHKKEAPPNLSTGGDGLVSRGGRFIFAVLLTEGSVFSRTSANWREYFQFFLDEESPDGSHQK